MREITQVSKIQYRKQDGAFFIYLWREHKDIWVKLRKRRIPIVVRIEVPEYVLEDSVQEKESEEPEGEELP